MTGRLLYLPEIISGFSAKKAIRFFIFLFITEAHWYTPVGFGAVIEMQIYAFYPEKPLRRNGFFHAFGRE